MLFIRKNLSIAHSSSTQVTEINTLDQTTALIETDHTISLAFKAFHNGTQFKQRFRCKQSLRLKYAMIKLNPGFRMIATIAVITEKKN